MLITRMLKRLCLADVTENGSRSTDKSTYLLSSCRPWDTCGSGSTGTGCGDAGRPDSYESRDTCTSDFDGPSVWRNSCIPRTSTGRSAYRSSCHRRRRTRPPPQPAAAVAAGDVGDDVCSIRLWRVRLERSGRPPTTAADDAVDDAEVTQRAAVRRGSPAACRSTRGCNPPHLCASSSLLAMMTSERRGTWPLQVTLASWTPFCRNSLRPAGFTATN